MISPTVFVKTFKYIQSLGPVIFPVMKQQLLQHHIFLVTFLAHPPVTRHICVPNLKQQNYKKNQLPKQCLQYYSVSVNELNFFAKQVRKPKLMNKIIASLSLSKR